MRRLGLIYLLIGLSLPVFSSELCKDFDDNANLIYVDCQTGQRVITKEEREQAQRLKEQAAKAQAAEQARAAQAEEKRLEKAIEKRKQQLEKERQKQEKQQQMAQTPQTVQIGGQTYYLSPKKQQATGIEPYDWMISAYGGFGTYLSGESNFDGVKIKVKNMTFWSGGLSGMFFLNRYLGVGVGAETDQFVRGKTRYSSSYASGSGWSSAQYGEYTPEISLEKLMFLGRLNVNPAHGARLYIPFGLGYGRVKETQKEQGFIYNWPGSSYSWNSKQSITKSTFVYFAGIGLEFDLTNYVSLGLEGRYNRFSYRGSTFGYVNGLAKVNVKF